MIVKAKKSVILVVAQVIELIFYDVCFCVCSLVDALQQIATTLGSKFWKFDAENCKNSLAPFIIECLSTYKVSKGIVVIFVFGYAPLITDICYVELRNCCL
jgi:hypothetical protein